MRNIAFHKSNLLLWIIAALFVAALALGIFAFRSESITAQLKTDRPLNLLVIIEHEGKPLSTQLLMFYPTRSKAALLDIPGNTAVILKTIKRMDRIDYTYKAGNPRNFITEISGYFDIPIQGYLLFDDKGFSRSVDLLDGLPLFIPTMIVEEGESPIRLPGGAVVLDGDKSLQYLLYREEGETDADLLTRRQKLMVSLLKRISEKSSLLGDRKALSAFASGIKSDYSQTALSRLLVEMAKLDADSVLLQKITGMDRNVEGNQLFFPYYDGELARDMLKQTLSAMGAATSGSTSGKIYTVEILNGTEEKGLAARTSSIFESFGYDVVAVGNFESLATAKTFIYDRYGDKEALTNVAGVIRCENFAEGETYGGSIVADFTIVLGKDFNGRFCVR